MPVWSYYSASRCLLSIMPILLRQWPQFQHSFHSSPGTVQRRLFVDAAIQASPHQRSREARGQRRASHLRDAARRHFSDERRTRDLRGARHARRGLQRRCRRRRQVRNKKVRQEPDRQRPGFQRSWRLLSQLEVVRPEIKIKNFVKLIKNFRSKFVRFQLLKSGCFKKKDERPVL